ncbi:hypothetical protein BpHYR1_015518 [Brachionus plicatilis]|uniref:Uncharacterized protein n=1 Tax=Brachionus plicatilis TaxID=10195 RepID=A0A3M7R0D6_BRAPC|nr:hypothetical protein BpHYR1_015518 [Brachionus plicatilis]
MAKNQKITKNELFVLVKWIEDKKKLYSVISRKDVIEPVHKELEVNAIYNAKYGKEEFKAELLLTGTKSECENVLQMLIRKSIKKTSNNKNSSEKCKNSNSDSKKRNKLVSDLNRKIEENEMKIQSLTEQLHVYSSINDHEFVKKIVSFSVQVLKHIGTPADIEEFHWDNIDFNSLKEAEDKNMILYNECLMFKEILKLYSLLNDEYINHFTSKGDSITFYVNMKTIYLSECVPTNVTNIVLNNNVSGENNE